MDGPGCRLPNHKSQFRNPAICAKPNVCASVICFAGPRKHEKLAGDYKERTSRSHGQIEIDRRMPVTKLAEISGNLRDACIRFLCRLGVTHKRSYREWTKPEQQRLLDLITTIPVEEAAKILHRPSASVRSMLHRLGMVGGQAAIGSQSSHCLGRCIPALTKYKNGSTLAGSSLALSPLPV